MLDFKFCFFTYVTFFLPSRLLGQVEICLSAHTPTVAETSYKMKHPYLCISSFSCFAWYKVNSISTNWKQRRYAVVFSYKLIPLHNKRNNITTARFSIQQLEDKRLQLNFTLPLSFFLTEVSNSVLLFNYSKFTYLHSPLVHL